MYYVSIYTLRIKPKDSQLLKQIAKTCKPTSFSNSIFISNFSYNLNQADTFNKTKFGVSRAPYFQCYCCNISLNPKNQSWFSNMAKTKKGNHTGS